MSGNDLQKDIKKAIIDITVESKIPFPEAFHKALISIHEMPTKDVLDMFLGECTKNAGDKVFSSVKYIETIRETKRHFNDIDLTDWVNAIIKIWK